MKSLKQTIRDTKSRISNATEQYLRPGMDKVGTRLRLRARIRHLNAQASKNPKWTFAIVVGSLLFLTGFTILTPAGKSDGKPQIATIETAGMDSVFDGFREIQANKDYQQKQVNEMTMAGQRIRHRLDSLIRLPMKTKGDSLEIMRCYNRLDRIVKYLNPKHKTDK
ncbi:MAG: hypothetical protein HDS87_04965 [Bacteroidales bacterium]|nr:hypothetical protein [Bacteroidales bacterium]